MTIDTSALNIVVGWSSIVGLIVWVGYEIRKDYQKLKTLVGEKQSIARCDQIQEEEKEIRVREREAVKADREARHGDH